MPLPGIPSYLSSTPRGTGDSWRPLHTAHSGPATFGLGLLVRLLTARLADSVAVLT
jgi:hypothetical protein